MTDDPPILSYASAATGPLSSGTDTFAFRPPPFVLSLIFNSLVACFFVGAAISVAARQSRLSQVRWDGRALLTLGILFGACALFGWQHWRRARHVIRFGGLPVKITIPDDQIILVDPPQWGLKVEAVRLCDVTRCEGGMIGWSLVGPTVYRIDVFLRDRETIELRVSPKEAAAAERAMAAIRARLPSATAAG
jgi:hypothetical protein